MGTGASSDSRRAGQQEKHNAQDKHENAELPPARLLIHLFAPLRSQPRATRKSLCLSEEKIRAKRESLCCAESFLLACLLRSNGGERIIL